MAPQKPNTKHHSYAPKGAFDCQHCGKPTAFRSHRRNFLEHLRTRLTGKVPFRCTRCNRRFWLIVDPRDI